MIFSLAAGGSLVVGAESPAVVPWWSFTKTVLSVAALSLVRDGQVTLDLLPGDSVRLKRSDYTICFLHPPGYSYFAMLRQKLHWSERPKGP